MITHRHSFLQLQYLQYLTRVYEFLLASFTWFGQAHVDPHVIVSELLKQLQKRTSDTSWPSME